MDRYYNTIISSNWYLYPLTDQKIVGLMKLRAQKPPSLNTFGQEMNVNLFVTVSLNVLNKNIESSLNQFFAVCSFFIIDYETSLQFCLYVGTIFGVKRKRSLISNSKSQYRFIS